MKIFAIGALLGFVTAISLNINEKAHHKQLHGLRKEQNHQFLSLVGNFLFGNDQQSVPKAQIKAEPKVEPKTEPKTEPKAPIAESAKSIVSDTKSLAQSTAPNTQPQAQNAVSDDASEEESGESIVVSVQSSIESSKQQSSFVPFQLPPTTGSTAHKFRKHKILNSQNK